ncbi:hypothetical protein [Streptosporangium amethystogenes]|uniref:hypothetical protein n=1 Tax=Streptosporangium amethystogenes TaxID=2002 RepID=UPI0004CC0B94|nr:hypothetical protein [Streptosporangium amethystogenes]
MRTSLLSHAYSRRLSAVVAAGLALNVAASALSPLPVRAATTAVSAAAPAGSSPWGPYYAPKRRAEATGTITVFPASIGPLEIPYASEVRIDGAVRDLTSPEVTGFNACGWAVFRFNHNPDYTSYEHVVTCTFLTPRKIALKKQRVRQVDIQVCAKPIARPGCGTDGTWQTLYIAR